MESSASVAPVSATLAAEAAPSAAPLSNSVSKPRSSVPFNSRMMRSAVFLPTPGMWDTRAMSWAAMASASSRGV